MKLKSRKLEGKLVALLAADGFDHVELAIPKAPLKAAWADVEVISLHDGKVRGMNLTEPTRTVRVRQSQEARRSAAALTALTAVVLRKSA